jgi:hypothetical protein
MRAMFKRDKARLGLPTFTLLNRYIAEALKRESGVTAQPF